MNKVICLLFLVVSTQVNFSQVIDTNSVARETDMRLGFITNLALIPQRTLFFPEKITETDFYKEQFGLVNTPDKIDRASATFQFGGNFAWILYTRSKKTEFEFGIHVGYQNSGVPNDRIYKQFTSNDTNYRIAEINIDYKLHELFTDGYFLIKSNNNFLDAFIGIGISYYVSVGKADVTHILFEKEIETYKTAYETYSNFNPYIPFGLEFPLSKKNDSFYMKLVGSIRREVNYNNFRPRRVFLTGGIQIQYQF